MAGSQEQDLHGYLVDLDATTAVETAQTIGLSLVVVQGNIKHRKLKALDAVRASFADTLQADGVYKLEEWQASYLCLIHGVDAIEELITRKYITL